jgi:hypothetical protein
MGFSKFMKKKGGTRRCRGTTSSTKTVVLQYLAQRIL